MLNIDDYRRINRFKDILHRYHFLNKDYDSFRKLACTAMDEIFGYHHILFGYLKYTKKKETSLQVLVYNTPDKFVERFFMSGALAGMSSDDAEDITLFSQTENYRKRPVYRDLLAPYGYSDLCMCYLPLDNCYVGYLVIFFDQAQKVFTHKDLEILSEINRYIAEEYHNFLKIVQLVNTNNLLISQSNQYPVGVIIMRDMMNTAYINETAKEYLAELGTSPQFFSVFFNNHLVPNIKNDLLHVGKKQIVRYNNYLFSVVVTNVLTEEFFRNLELARKTSDQTEMSAYSTDATTYIYIMRDDVSSFVRKGDPFEEISLTKRERQVAELLLRGKSADEISEELAISPNTAKVHIQRIYRKANVTSRAEFLFIMNQYNI